MGEKFDARRAKKMFRLSAAAELYRVARQDGATDPTATVARLFGVNRSTAGSWIHRARAEGLLPATVQGRAKADDHEPRRVDWGADSWTACGTCLREWPCVHAGGA